LEDVHDYRPVSELIRATWERLDSAPHELLEDYRQISALSRLKGEVAILEFHETDRTIGEETRRAIALASVIYNGGLLRGMAPPGTEVMVSLLMPAFIQSIIVAGVLMDEEKAHGSKD
jgi:hypothetical protein